ncbi:hypothetical protein HY413_00325 [Candidatus Kaiserbacteria bacterium]|nr:hypothetical protein [Candidatus Kaiserbacteria bacterium]
MSKYRVTVFGAGGMGIPTVFDQAFFGETKQINLVEPNRDRLQYAMKRLTELLGERADKISYFQQTSALVLEGVDAAISCAPHVVNAELTQQVAIEFDVPFCDLGGCGEVVEKQAMLAENTGRSVVPDCGVSPGTANILEVHLAKRGCKRIRARCGGNPATRPDPQVNPLLYKAIYNLEGLASGLAGWCYELEDNRLIQVPAVGYVEPYDEEFESAPTSHHSRFSIEHLRSLGVESCNYQTLRYHGHYAELAKMGWKHDGNPHRLAEQLMRRPELAFDREKDVDRLTLIVEDQSGSPSYKYDILADPITKFTAMELMTSWGISIVAHHMASGRGKPDGFAMPQEFVDTTWYINELNRRIKHFNVL